MVCWLGSNMMCNQSPLPHCHGMRRWGNHSRPNLQFPLDQFPNRISMGNGCPKEPFKEFPSFSSQLVGSATSKRLEAIAVSHCSHSFHNNNASAAAATYPRQDLDFNDTESPAASQSANISISWLPFCADFLYLYQ